MVTVRDCQDDEGECPLLVSFRMAVEQSYEAGLFKELCRLKGYSLPKSGIAIMIDQATGLEETRHREFIGFVRRYVWQPWLSQMLATTPPPADTVLAEREPQ